MDRSKFVVEVWVVSDPAPASLSFELERMSNATLQQNVHGLCEAYRRGELPLRELARQVGLHADSFEALPFEQRQALETLALHLELQADYADEACEYQAEVERILSALGDWLRRIPA